MKKLLFAFLILLGSAGFAGAQTTVVTGTITDTNSTPYANGRLSITLLNNGGQQALFQGSPQFTQQYNAALDANGAFTITLPANSSITPYVAGNPALSTQWTFTYQSVGGYGAASASITITGSSQSVTGNLSALARISWPSGSPAPPGLNTQVITSIGNGQSAWGTGGGGGGAVSSVFTRTGAVVALANDYNFNQLAGTASLTSQVTGLLPHANIASTAVTPGAYTNANITVGADGSLTAASNGSGGASGITNQVAKGIPANLSGTATVLDSIVCTPPATIGTFNILYSNPTAAATVPQCPQVGLAARGDAATSGSPILPADTAAGDVVYGAATAAAVTVGNVGTLANTNPVFATDNNLTAGNITFTPTANPATINGGGTLVELQKQHCLWMVNPALATDWFVPCVDRAGYINGTQLSALASGLVFNTTATGIPSIATSAQIVAACTTCVATGQTNVYGAFLQDFTAGTMEVPEAAGFTANVNSTIGLDTTANAQHIFVNGADALSAAEAAPIAAGFIPKSTDATHGLLTATLCDEGITTANTLTCTNTAGLKVVSLATGTAPCPNLVAGTSGVQCGNEGTTPTGTNTAVDFWWQNATAHCEDEVANNVELGCALVQPAGLVGVQTVTGADYTNTTVTPSTVFSWTLPATAAAKNYKYTCDIMWESTAATLVGPVFGLNISAAPTQLTGMASVQNTLAGADINGYLSNTTTGSQTLVTSSAAGVTSTNYWAKIWGTIEGAAVAGSTFIINAASTSGTTANLDIRRGSACKLELVQ